MNPNGIPAFAQGRRACEATLGDMRTCHPNRNAVVAAPTPGTSAYGDPGHARQSTIAVDAAWNCAVFLDFVGFVG